MKINNIKFFIFFTVTLVFKTNIFCMNFFLQAPEQVKSVNKNRTISMCWHNSMRLENNKNASKCHFVYNKKSGAYVNLFFKELPDFIDKNEECLFEKLEKKHEEFNFVFCYGVCPQMDEASSEEKSFQNGSYWVGDILDIKDQKNVNKISIEELVGYIKSKNIIFYTGAGISMASKVFSMDQLERALGFVHKGKFNAKDFVKNFINNPKNIAKVFEEFCESMLNAPATKAHGALFELANYKKCKIVTENLDNLHQVTGIEPYMIMGDEFRQEVKNEWARDIDAIICCGLSHDDRGFLGWYKKYNPNGVIIAIDLGLPNYLGEKDFVLNGDIQEVIPKICSRVKELLN